ncbi:hypothetical protein GCM10018954_057820 [Kutzneria kofuensis]
MDAAKAAPVAVVDTVASTVAPRASPRAVRLGKVVIEPSCVGPPGDEQIRCVWVIYAADRGLTRLVIG